MSTPEPPAPTPSATTCPEHTGKAVYRINSDGRCIGCGKRQVVIAQEPVVPPASVPAVTAGTETPEDHAAFLASQEFGNAGVRKQLRKLRLAAHSGEEVDDTMLVTNAALAYAEYTVQDEAEAAAIRQACARLTAQATALATLRSENERLRTPAMCGVCGGRGIPVSGKPCICGGIGTEQAEMDGLRQACFDYEAELAALREAATRTLAWMRREKGSNMDTPTTIRAALSAVLAPSPYHKHT